MQENSQSTRTNGSSPRHDYRSDSCDGDCFRFVVSDASLNVTRTLNAQGCTEVRRNVLPNCVMLHLAYRFNLNPKK